MKSIMTMIRRTALLLAACASAAATGQVPAYADMDSYGTIRPNACAPTQLALLKKDVDNAASDAAQAWKAIVAMLCTADQAANRERIKRFVPIYVREAQEGTGQAPVFQRTRRSDELLQRLSAAGKAWEASVDVASDKIVLQYFPDEACVASRTLLYAKGKWTLADIGEACD